MKLKNTYVVGVHIMWYEVEMVEEYVLSCRQMLEDVENRENVTFHFTINMQEYLEECSTSLNKLLDKIKGTVSSLSRMPPICEEAHIVTDYDTLQAEVQTSVVFSDPKVVIDVRWGDNRLQEPPFYNIAQYRRDLNYNYCDRVDFVLWGETDSLWPAETFPVIENVAEYAEQNGLHRYILNFADRKMWDPTWEIVEHEDYTHIVFEDTEDWNLNHPASSKSYMTLEQMNEVNARAEEFNIITTREPKFDGACLVISSDLIRSGVNIPHALIHCGEDTSLGEMARLVLGKEYLQFVVKNILRVHNRRHPHKRSFIRGEDNPRGFCGPKKGEWWDILEKSSKHNLSQIRGSQRPFIRTADVLKKIREILNA
jgi:hypothetical protein